MTNLNLIKSAFERAESGLKARPEAGRKTALTRVRLQDGLTCQIEEGDWKLN